jgi:hypothetical protein
MAQQTTKRVGIWILALSLFMAHLLFRGVAHADEGGASPWKTIYAKGGECTIAFPSAPQLVEQALNLPEGQTLFYDVYLAPFENKGVFLFLVASYPATLSPGQENMGVEGLLKGIVGHRPDNKLIFANAIQIQGYTGTTFLVQSETHYFRGQALMVGNKLFLIAMEGKKEFAVEPLFLQFAKSFRLPQKK